MVKINDNYLKLPGSYLFSTVARKVAEFSEANPDKEIIRLGIGDVTRPLTASILAAMHNAVDEMGKEETFRGYSPDLGYASFRMVRSPIVPTSRKSSMQTAGSP